MSIKYSNAENVVRKVSGPAWEAVRLHRAAERAYVRGGQKYDNPAYVKAWARAEAAWGALLATAKGE